MEAMAARRAQIVAIWKRGPSGLNAMGFDLVSKPADPNNPNPTLAAMVDGAKKRGK